MGNGSLALLLRCLGCRADNWIPV